MGEIQFPKFKLVSVQTEPSNKQEVIPSYLDGDFNGDKIPDRVEIIQEGNKVGVRLKLGTYQKVVDPAPLFGNIAATLGYKSDVIWEASSPGAKDSGAVRLEHFGLGDYNSDGDLDIQFVVQKQVSDNTSVRGIFVLMNQSIVDINLAQMEGATPVLEEDKVTPPADKKSKPSGRGDTLGFWSPRWTQKQR